MRTVCSTDCHSSHVLPYWRGSRGDRSRASPGAEPPAGRAEARRKGGSLTLTCGGSPAAAVSRGVPVLRRGGSVRFSCVGEMLRGCGHVLLDDPHGLGRV